MFPLISFDIPHLINLICLRKHAESCRALAQICPDLPSLGLHWPAHPGPPGPLGPRLAPSGPETEPRGGMAGEL